MFPNIFSRFFCLGIFSVYLLFGLTHAAAGDTPSGRWETLKAKYLTVTYENIQDLNLFNEKIDFSPDANSFSSFLSANQPSGTKLRGTKPRGTKVERTALENQVIQKMDALVEKVQLILDMRKPMNLIVKLYPDKTALQGAYFNIYKKKREFRAWYIFEYNTIYLNVQDLFAEMLAHEIAHAIVNNYLSVRPPRATAEILARYVGKHLNKKAKVY
jgi:hypothetical protein